MIPKHLICPEPTCVLLGEHGEHATRAENDAAMRRFQLLVATLQAGDEIRMEDDREIVVRRNPPSIRSIDAEMEALGI